MGLEFIYGIFIVINIPDASVLHAATPIFYVYALFQTFHFDRSQDDTDYSPTVNLINWSQNVQFVKSLSEFAGINMDC